MKAVVKLLKLTKHARLPVYSYSDDIAADLYASVSKIIRPGTTVLIPTGLAVELPVGYGAKVEDRSGLALKGLTTLGGVIDPGYRGEIKVIAANISRRPISVVKSSRIAQLRLIRRIPTKFVEVRRLSASKRGIRGFGSTGTR